MNMKMKAIWRTLRYSTGWTSSSMDRDGEVEHYPYCNKIAKTEEHGARNAKIMGSIPRVCMN